MSEFRADLRFLQDYWPAKSPPTFPKLFAEVGGPGVAFPTPGPQNERPEEAYRRRRKAVVTMSKLHEGEGRAWQFHERWEFVPDGELLTHNRFRPNSAVVFPCPRTITGETTSQPVARCSGERPGVWPDFNTARNTLTLQASGGKAGIFARDMQCATLPTLFRYYLETQTAARIYKAWLEAAVVCSRAPFRGSRAGRRKA